MTAAIKDFVKEWSHHFKLNVCKKTSTWSLIKLNKEKHNLPLLNQPSFFYYWLMRFRFGFVHQLIESEPERFFHLLRCTIPEAAPPRGLPKVLWMKKIEIVPALAMTGSSRASSLSSSHSSNIIIFWWTAAVFQHSQHNILNKNIVRIFNIELTVKDTNTDTRDHRLNNTIIIIIKSMRET